MMLLFAALTLMGGLFAASRAAAGQPFYENCSDRSMFPQMQGSFALSPSSGPVGTPFKLSGSGRPDKQIYVSWGLGSAFMEVPFGFVNTDPLGNLEGNYVVPASMPWYQGTSSIMRDVVPGTHVILLKEFPGPEDGGQYFPYTECLAFEVTEGSQVSLDAYDLEPAGSGITPGVLPETGMSMYEIGMLVLISGVFLFGRKYLGG
jgi:hypothetical protein